MKIRAYAFLAASLLALSAQGNARDLVWSEEFDAPALDRSTWNVIGPELWVNNEQQAYVDDPQTIAIVREANGAEGGALRLQPVFRPAVDPHAERKADFVSGRIDSKGKFSSRLRSSRRRWSSSSSRFPPSRTARSATRPSSSGKCRVRNARLDLSARDQ